jgi:hypothetical protein
MSSRKSVLVTDTIILKSRYISFKISLGNFLRIEDNDGLRADSSIPSDRCFWHLCKAKVPFIPNWARINPYLSSSYLTPSLNPNRMLEENSEKKKTRDPRLETTASQEKVIIHELLYVLLSIEGKYIKRKEDPMNNRYFYVIDNDSQLDGSLVLMVSKILPLCELHDRILIFIQKYSSFDHGTIFQALANAVKAIRRDYVAAINALDQDFQKGHFTLQRLWYETQKPSKSSRGSY